MLSLLLSQCPFMAVLALHEQVPRVMDHHSSGCLPGGNFSHSHLVRGLGTNNSFRSPSSVHLTSQGASPLISLAVFNVAEAFIAISSWYLIT